jgi:cytochrome c551/c552
MRLSSGVLLFGLGVSAILACSSSTPEAQAPEAEPPEEGAAGADTAAAPTPLPDVWDEKNMTKDQQIAFMKERVMPAMAPVFKEHDPKAFEKFGCETCHGPEYKEPTEYLPALTLKDGNLTSFVDDPETSKWMAEKVVPAMAAAMGLPAYDPATHQGFGCGGCHAIEGG